MPSKSAGLGQSASQRQPPTYVFFGRTPWDDAWMPWQSLSHRLVRSHHVVYVQDPARSGRHMVGGTVHLRPDGIAEFIPCDYPLQRWAMVRSLARRAHVSRIRGCLDGAPGPLVAVLAPRAPLELVESLCADLIVYHAIDEYSRLSTDREDEKFLEWERAALKASDLVIGASEPITARLRVSGARAASTITNGFDEEFLDGCSRPPPPELAGLRRPIVGFAGTVRANRLDMVALEGAVRARPGHSFVFVGTEFDDEAGTLGSLKRHPNVRFVPFQRRDRIADFLSAFDVAIAPYRDTPVNRACYPLKVLDALAMGRPVVLTPERPDLAGLGPGLRLARDAGSLLAALDAAIEEGNGPDATRLRRLSVEGETWARKTELFEDAVRSALDGLGGGTSAG